MKYIELTRGKVAIVDDKHYEYLNQFKWRALKDNNTWYAGRSDSDKNIIRMHREIMGVTDSKIIVDHADGDGLNNLEENLRICTHGQNMANRRKQINNTSGYRGVYWEKNDKKWRASVKVNGVTKNLGNYDDIEEAARARDEAAKIYYGEFARLNFTELEDIEVK